MVLVVSYLSKYSNIDIPLKNIMYSMDKSMKFGGLKLLAILGMEVIS